MHSRFAALFLGLGIVDLGYVNLALGPDVFATPGAPMALEAAPAEPVVVIQQSQPSLATSAPLDQPAPAPEPARAMPPELRAPAPAPVAARAIPEDKPGATRPTLDKENTITGWTVQFPRTATADLPDQARETLSTIAQWLMDDPGLHIRIVGHADARGTREYNRDLGGRRARAVAETLVRAGASREQLVVRTRGEDEPRAEGSTEETWATNRRVEIAIHTPRSHTP